MLQEKGSKKDAIAIVQNFTPYSAVIRHGFSSWDIQPD